MIERAALRRGSDPHDAAGRLLDALAYDLRLLERLIDVALPGDRREALKPAA